MAKKLWERVQEDIEKNRQASEQIRVNANNQFNENIKQNGEFDTNKHTYQMNDLLQSYKDTSKERYNTFKRANGITLWDTVKQIANDLGRVTENTWLGGISGTKQSFNYTYKSGRNHLESEERQKLENVINSSNLNKSEKDFYINMQKNNNNSKEEKEQNKALQIASQKSKSVQEINKSTEKQGLYLPISKRGNIILPKSEATKTEEVNIEKIKKATETSGFDESIEKDNIKIAENTEKQSNGITKKLAELAPSIGNMAVGGAVSALNPGAGTAYFALSSAGSYYDDAKQRGMTNTQAENYAGIMGLMEGTTEEITVGNLRKAGNIAKTLVKGTGKEVAKEGLEELGKASIKTALKEYGIGIADNVMQEALIEPIQETVASLVGGEDKANWENMGQRMLQSGIDGGLVAVITGGAEIGIQSCVGIVEKSKNGETITQEDLKTAVKDASKEIDVEKSIIDSTRQQINKYKDYNTNQPLDSVSQQWLNRANDIINENSNSNLQQNTTNNPINPLIQQSNSQENKVAQNENMEQIKIDSENFARQVDDYIAGNMKTGDFINVGKTSQTLQDIGLPNNDIILKQSKLKAIMKESNNPNSSLHGLSAETVKKIPQALNNPLNVLKSSTNDKSVVIITDLADKLERPIITSIEMNYKGQIGEIEFLSNRLTSAYGKNNYDRFMQTEIAKGNLLYDIDEGIIKRLPATGLQSPKGISLFEDTVDNVSSVNNSIAQNDNSVKNTITNNYAQSNGNNSITDNNLANNQQTMYNNTESEGGINGREEVRQSNRDVFEQSTNEINTEGQTTINAREGFEKRFNVESEGGINEESRRTKQDDKRRVQELFEKYQRGETNGASNIKELFRNQETRGITEQEVKKTLIDYANKYSKTELNENEIKLKNIINNLGGNVVFYEYGNNNIFEGLADKSTFYIDTLSESKTNNIFYHELTHFLRQNNNEIYMKEIQPIVEKIASDFNYQEAIFNYANTSGEYFDVRKLDGSLQIELAEEVVADQIASMYGDLEADYGIDSKIKEQLKTSMDKILNFNENLQEQTNTTSQLKEVEANTQSLGYKPDIEGKQRKHYKSIIESDQVGEAGKKVAKSLLETDTYQPISNVETLARANETIASNGVDNTYIAFKTKMNSNERITLQDIAIGERLIQIFSQNGNIEKHNDLMQDVAILGTEIGQITQALSLIKKMSPEGQLMFLNKIVGRLNLKENADLKVTDEMSKRILETKNQEELENVMTDIAVELGEQLPVTLGDKIRAWRYLSMLGNPKTHDKNILANVAMNVTQQLKNKVAGATEDVVGMFNKDMERTKTLRPANKDQRNFAKQDAEFMKDKIDGGGKYDIKNAIQKNKKQFNNKILNAIANFNSKMLELEDNIFLKMAYKQALQNYMSANKLSSSDMENSSVLQKAREYASYQAQEATFHQFSALAQRLTEIENKGGIAGKTLEAVVPFKKTPINIAKSGVEYSPIGLAKSLSYDLAQINKKTKEYKTKLEKGFISEAEYKTGTSKLVTKTIDDMAKGLTGTSLALLGYALKDMGILKSGNDGEDDEFKEKLGEQEYAIKIGDNTYTLDWVSPSAIPMFMGATVHDLVHSQDEDNSNTLNSLMTSSAKALEPMTEMSMLQGLTSAISSYEQGSSNMLFDLGASAVSSYLGQFVPTALGQVAKTIDDKERDTSSTEKGLAKKVDQFKKQQLAKIPIASKLLPARKDVWGNEKTRDSNPLVRAYEVGLAPYNRKKVVEDYTEKELLKVFEDTGEKSVLPGIPNKDITINKQKYRLTAEEYNKAKETFGKTSKSMLDSLVKTSEYKQLSDEQKIVAIDNIYSYAKEKIKVNYAKGKKQEVETSSSYNILNELKNPTNQSEYLSYSAKIQGIEKDTEKKKILADGKYSTTTKETIYKNTLGKEDDLYNNILAKDSININEYLNYKLQKFESDKEDDGTVKGKSIKGSRPKKLYDYVNNMNITRSQKLAIIGSQCKLDRNEQRELYNYINNIPGQTQKKKLEMFSKYSSNFIVNKDNTINLNYK